MHRLDDKNYHFLAVTMEPITARNLYIYNYREDNLVWSPTYLLMKHRPPINVEHNTNI